MPPAWSTIRIRSTPALRSCAPARTPAIPPPTITTSTSSVTAARSVRDVKGSSRNRAKCSSRVRSRMAARPGTSRLSRSARYLAWTASGSKPDTNVRLATLHYGAAVDLGLQGRAAIVTGASRGIGRHIALGLAAEGCRVLLCARSADALAAVGSELDGAGVAMPVDVTDPAAADAIVTECQRAFGRLDIVMNNAGTAVPKPLAELTASDWQGGLDLNFLAAARLSVAAARVMRVARWGRLVHVASISGREPDPLFAPYSAAKAALLNLSTALSRAFAADGVLSS